MVSLFLHVKKLPNIIRQLLLSSLLYKTIIVLCIVLAVLPIQTNGQSIKKYKNKVEPKKFVENVAFEIQSKKMIVLTDIKINGSSKTYKFLFDTGTTMSSISKELAQDLGVEIVGEDNFTDGYKTKKIKTSYVDFTISNVKYKNIRVSIDTPNENLLTNVDGIIGCNLIKNSVWKLNLFDNQILMTNNIKNIKNVESYYKQKIKILGGAPFVNGCFGDKYGGDMLFDLGNNGTILIYKPDYSHFKRYSFFRILEGKGLAEISTFSNNISKTKQTVLIKADKFNFGKSKIKSGKLISENYKNSVNDIVTFFIPSDNVVNVIGVGILDIYSIIIDLSHKHFYSKIIKNKKGYVSFGFDVMPIDNKFIIPVVWENSSAHKQGFKVGDRILQINSLDLRNNSNPIYKIYQQIEQILKNNDTIEVTFIDKNQKEHTLNVKKENLFK